jgi:hypothetical protein
MTQHVSSTGSASVRHRRGMKCVPAALFALLAALALPRAATAHNLGHIFLPDGVCLGLGSGLEAPVVGQDRTQLDLVPQTANPPRDEYGVSFVGYYSIVGGWNTPVLPGPCPVQRLPAATPSAPAGEGELWADQGFNGM